MTNNITQSQREQFWEDPDITNQPNQSYDKYSDDELLEEVKEYYPELLEEN